MSCEENHNKKTKKHLDGLRLIFEQMKEGEKMRKEGKKTTKGQKSETHKSLEK